MSSPHPGADERPDSPPPSSYAAAGALAHPTRRRIVEALSERPGGMTVKEIAGGIDLHHNAVRQHLRTLASAGVVASMRDEPKGRGRPTLRYWVVDVEAPRGMAHRELVRLLVGLVQRANFDESEIEAFGQEAGARLAEGADRQGLMAAIARLGFAPREISSAADAEVGTLDLALEHCPFREAVLAPGGAAVCTLHKGLIDGMASQARPPAELTRFDPKDPRHAGCRVRIDGLAKSEE